jgi:prepilin-type N-terminal cleavage/methylation domain-containing protein
VRQKDKTTERRGFSLLEVVVAMLIFVIGVVALASFFVLNLRQNQRALDMSTAAFLAQQKAEEIRRDDSSGRDIIAEIKTMTTPSAPTTFPNDPRFAYRYCGRSVVDPVSRPGDVRTYYGVARVIVQYDAAFRPAQDILYELRFDR